MCDVGDVECSSSVFITTSAIIILARAMYAKNAVLMNIFNNMSKAVPCPRPMEAVSETWGMDSLVVGVEGRNKPMDYAHQ